jgi:hypothetical protein
MHHSPETVICLLTFVCALCRSLGLSNSGGLELYRSEYVAIRSKYLDFRLNNFALAYGFTPELYAVRNAASQGHGCAAVFWVLTALLYSFCVLAVG